MNQVGTMEVGTTEGAAKTGAANIQDTPTGHKPSAGCKIEWAYRHAHLMGVCQRSLLIK